MRALRGVPVVPLTLLALACSRHAGGEDSLHAESKADPARRASTPRRRRIVDAHVHVAPTEIGRLNGIMDEVGIAWAVNLSGHWPGGPLEAQLDAAKRSGRLVVACNLPWFAASKLPNFPELSVQLLRQAKSLGARGLKIEKALGLRARKMDGSLLAVDDPWLDPIWNAAGDLGLPVIIHTGDPKAFWLPVDEKNERFEELSAHPSWSYSGEREIPSFEQLLKALMAVVARHPSTTFVAVHFGNNSEDPFWVDEMLDAHPNLYVDIAARIVELGRHDPERLRKVFIEHSRRILFGTDLGVSPENFLMLGSFGKEPNRREEIGPFFRAHSRWLETREDMPSPTPIQGRWTIHGLGLPEEVLEDVYAGNATRLFGPPPASEGAPAFRMPAP